MPNLMENSIKLVSFTHIHAKICYRSQCSSISGGFGGFRCLIFRGNIKTVIAPKSKLNDISNKSELKSHKKCNLMKQYIHTEQRTIILTKFCLPILCKYLAIVARHQKSRPLLPNLFKRVWFQQIIVGTGGCTNPKRCYIIKKNIYISISKAFSS